MSGGSFNHLHAAEVVNIGDLADMAHAVEHLAPGSRAAVNTALAVQLLQDNALRQVWQAVEQRADGGADVVFDAVNRYESSDDSTRGDTR